VRAEGAKARKPGLSQKEQRRLAEVEQALADLHARISDLDAILAESTAFLRPDSPGHQALKDRDSRSAELENLELEWLELEEKRTGY
jgi:ATP-binding cassette subfamily F protein uup